MTEKGLEQSLREWLETEGYPLEIRVAREFRGRGFKVQQSEYYKNPEGTFREIDVLAVRGTMCDDPEITTLVELNVVVECKGFPARPWIVFSAPLDPYTRDHERDERMGTERGRDLLSTALMAGDLAGLELFKVRERAGYSVVPAFKGNDDAYKAVTGVADAAHARSNLWADLQGDVDLFGIYFPVVVINAPLFECFENADGTMQLEPRDHMPLFWRRSFYDLREFTVIDIVTETGLRGFAEQIDQLYAVLDRVYSNPQTRRERALSPSARRAPEDGQDDGETNEEQSKANPSGG